MRRSLRTLFIGLAGAGALVGCFPVPGATHGPASDARMEQRSGHNTQIRAGTASELSSSPGGGEAVVDATPLPPEHTKF